MNSIFKLFLDKLSERIFALLGNHIGTAATTYHAVALAEQQSALEELARRYESEGKDDLADNLRRQSAQLSLGDPARTGQEILQQLTEPKSSNPPQQINDVLPAVASMPDRHSPTQTPESSARSRRKPRPTPSANGTPESAE